MRLETQINKTSACNHWCRGCIAITPGPSYSQPIKHTSKPQEPMLKTCAVCMHFKSLNKETIRLCTRFYVLMAALLWLSRWALSSSNLAPVCECTSSPFRKNLKLGTALTPHFLINACIHPMREKGKLGPLNVLYIPGTVLKLVNFKLNQSMQNIQFSTPENTNTTITSISGTLFLA